jgi:thioredoxin reductase
MMDCLIIGGGPAGLTAQITLPGTGGGALPLTLAQAARQLSLLAITIQASKASPAIELIDRLRKQAEYYGAVIQSGDRGFARSLRSICACSNRPESTCSHKVRRGA